MLKGGNRDPPRQQNPNWPNSTCTSKSHQAPRARRVRCKWASSSSDSSLIMISTIHQQPELQPHTKGKPAHTAESIHRGREPTTSEVKLTRMVEKRLVRTIANEAYRTPRKKGETGLSGRLLLGRGSGRDYHFGFRKVF